MLRATATLLLQCVSRARTHGSIQGPDSGGTIPRCSLPANQRWRIPFEGWSACRKVANWSVERISAAVIPASSAACPALSTTTNSARCQTRLRSHAQAIGACRSRRPCTMIPGTPASASAPRSKLLSSSHALCRTWWVGVGSTGWRRRGGANTKACISNLVELVGIEPTASSTPTRISRRRSVTIVTMAALELKNQGKAHDHPIGAG
jgi:hypothetical protein